MNREKIDLCKYEIEKAKETLKAAEVLCNDNFLISAVNRIYYAMFYSVTALFTIKKLTSSKHSAVMSNFDREIINKGFLDKEYGKFYRLMFDKRNFGDYGPFSNFSNEDVKEWLNKAEDFLNAIENLTVKMIKESETVNKRTDIPKNNGNNGGFTLMELVMTIILTGILAVGLYAVVMFGINDYLTNENYLHSSNSMTYAMSVIRRNLVNAAMPLSNPNLTIGSGDKCPLSNYPSDNQPIALACQDGSAPSNNTCPVSGSGSSPVPPSEIAFYQNVNGTTNQQLVVFCVNNNILYQEVITNNGTTTSYPIADNISNISF